MSERTLTEMDSTEIAEFLDRHHIGVLSLADGDDAYAFPVSFAVGESEQDIYFRLGFAPGSQKRSFLDATDHATFVVFDQIDDRWASVVANGRLVELEEKDVDAVIVQAVERLDIPFFRVFDRPASDLDFTLVRLEAGSMRGIVEAE